MPLHQSLRSTYLCFLLFALGLVNAKAAPLSLVSTFTVLQEPVATLQAPQGVIARASFVKTIVVRWQAVEGAESYVVERADSELGIYTELATVSSSALAYKDQELGLSQTAFYRVKAVVAGVESEPSPVASATTNPDDVIRIMPLGDSNTDGGSSNESNGVPIEKRVSYRKELYRLLIAVSKERGYKFDFIGTENSGQSFAADFLRETGVELDLDHAGFGGFRNEDLTDIIRNGYEYRWYDKIRFGLDHQENYLEHFKPDVILLHSGTNDISNEGFDNSQATINKLNELLDEVDLYENTSGREVTVILSKIIKSVCTPGNCYGSEAGTKNQIIDLYNTKMEALATERISKGDNLILVDMADAGIIYSSVDMADRLHPNQHGYDKMAPVWYNGLAQDLALVPLPVEITKFSAASTNGEVELDWRTASEKDNDRFEVERMQEGQPFQIIGTVAGAGNSIQPLSYTFRDQNPPIGEAYYRLKQVDTDGTYTYSKVVSVRNIATPDVAAILYPNPTNGHEALFLRITGLSKDTPVEVVLVDAFGRKLHQLNMRTSSSGMLNDQLQLPYNLSKGLYILQVNTAAQSQSLKLAVK